jgi:hypothetical protein
VGGVVEISGGLSAGPAAGCGCGDASLVFPFEFPGGCAGKGYSTMTKGGRTIISPATYVELPSIGPTGDVTTADVFALACSGSVELELTMNDGVGGTTVAVVPVQGLFICTFFAPKYLIGVRVRGNSQISYMATGPA